MCWYVLSSLFYLVVLYAMSASYFAGVMVRLMLTLTPVVCVLAAIAISRTLEIYLKDEVKKTTRRDDDREHSEKLYDKVMHGDN